MILVGILITFIIYKLISHQLEKRKEESIRIINECKTENEKKDKLNALKRKNIKRSILHYFVFMIVLILICFLLLLIIRSIPSF